MLLFIPYLQNQYFLPHDIEPAAISISCCMIPENLVFQNAWYGNLWMLFHYLVQFNKAPWIGSMHSIPWNPWNNQQLLFAFSIEVRDFLHVCLMFYTGKLVNFLHYLLHSINVLKCSAIAQHFKTFHFICY